MVVKLSFETIYDPVLEKKVKGFEIVRLKTLVLFKRVDGNIEIRDGIVDTGAYVTLIPQSIWKNLEIEKIAKHEIMGLSIKPECAIPVIIGKTCCSLIDEHGSTTGELKFHSYLALTDKVPLIIGFKDLLSRFKVCFDYKRKEAYLETKVRKK
ncbi:MAG: hypothetical protein L6265_09030 [Thermoplasmatales archaeon]|nr:hypothetical protein [Candidatus Thermoplasmatota archaeon]MCG2826719.1 hypothetical protein [Thermoplasmatales archaeon]